MTRKEVRKSILYWDTCDVCGKEVRVDEGKKCGTCYDCKCELAMRKAKQAMAFMIGATIIDIMPTGYGRYISEDLGSLTVRTTDGRVIEFTAGGWDERYIEWGDVKLGEKEDG